MQTTEEKCGELALQNCCGNNEIRYWGTCAPLKTMTNANKCAVKSTYYFKITLYGNTNTEVTDQTGGGYKFNIKFSLTR